MKKVKQDSPEVDSLRQKAEELLQENHKAKGPAHKASDEPVKNEADILKLVLELSIHQLELEMQNEELQLAIHAAENAAKQYAEIYEEIYDFSPAGYFSLNHDCTISKLNLSGARLLGGNRTDLLDCNFRNFITHETLPAFNDFLQRINETNLKQTCEIRLSIKGNPSSYIHLEGIEPDYGRKYLVSAVDITSRKLAEQALHESEARLRELNATKDKFFSIIAHDIKSPFNSIKGSSQFLLREFETLRKDEVLDMINQIHLSSGNSLKLLDNLLQWAESQTGLIAAASERIDLAKLVPETIEWMRSAAEEKNISIHSAIQSGTIAIADNYMLRTILRNLLNNAIKFTFGKGKVEIEAQPKENEILVSVKDDGTGFRPADLENVFRVDHKLMMLGTANEKGSGLGLILCKEFVEKQGGKIWIESEFGKGSSIHFTLPKG
jgi:PAS domain S-box-containing protein